MKIVHIVKINNMLLGAYCEDQRLVVAQSTIRAARRGKVTPALRRAVQAALNEEVVIEVKR